MNGGDEQFSPSRVRRRLSELSDDPEVAIDRIPGLSTKGLTEAAVLAALTEIDGQMCALFTGRPETMPEHSGEVSFPGGRQEEGDRDLQHTALRETEEEISLAPDDVRVYGVLVRMPTVTGYVVTTYVGEFDQPYVLDPNPREIETLFTAPLQVLAEPERHRVEQRQWGEYTFDLHFFDYEGHVIWGATGYMVHLLLEFLRGESIQEITSHGLNEPGA